MNRLICNETGEAFALDDPRWCSEKGKLLTLEFQPHLDISRLSQRKSTLWRYREAIPIDYDENIVSFDEGFTPLLPMRISGRTIYIKQDHLFPTGSFKDRGATILISKVKELGIRHVVQDSSGNAGAAIAAYCARAGIACDIYVPEKTLPEKLRQIRSYNATLHLVPGSREDTASAALAAAGKYYYASHCWNPFFHHGVKTFAYEVCEQLGWCAPDAVILPVGNGSLLIGVFIGFKELLAMQIIEKMPRMIAIQALACAPVYLAFARGKSNHAVHGETIAEGIAIAQPVRIKEMLAAITESNGTVMTVDDDAIKRTQIEMAKKGFYIEVTAAAAMAGVESYLEQSEREELIVTSFTGHGLKSGK